jgi:hypothetical protein
MNCIKSHATAGLEANPSPAACQNARYDNEQSCNDEEEEAESKHYYRNNQKQSSEHAARNSYRWSVHSMKEAQRQ